MTMPTDFTYRRQGRSRLGLRMPEGTAPTNANKAKVWEARGVPGQWSTGVLTAWLNKQKCQDIFFDESADKTARLAVPSQPSDQLILFCLRKCHWREHLHIPNSSIVSRPPSKRRSEQLANPWAMRIFGTA